MSEPGVLLLRQAPGLLRQAPGFLRQAQPSLARLRRLAPRRPQLRAPRRLPMRAGAGLAWAATGLVVFTCFLHMSRSVPVNSDGASNALQAWDMLHGNPLLRGWVLSDVSFYTTELPQYLVIELVRGLTPDVVHIAAAMTYTCVVLLAARLAKGAATGTQGVLRAFLAAGIMAAPQRSEVSVLILSPDHVGSTVPVLAMWLLIDRAGRRWYVPVASFLLVTLALVADQVVLLTGVLPLLLVALVRMYDRVAGGSDQRQRLHGTSRWRSVTARAASAWFEFLLAAAAVGGAETGWRVLAAISARGGFVVWGVQDRLIGSSALGTNLLQTYHGILLLFGADFMGQRAGYAVAIAMVHLVGIGLAGWALFAAMRRFRRADVAVQLMAAGLVVNLVAFALGPNARQVFSSREFAAVLPFGAALAGRMLATRLSRAQLVPALVLVLAVYVVGAVRVIAHPPVAARNQAVASWLAAHGLTSGLAGYWQANSITLDSGGKVDVRAVRGSSLSAWPRPWEDKPDWFDPAAHTATFFVLPSCGPGQDPPGCPDGLAPTGSGVINLFGQPARVYYLPGGTVLVWNANLLAELQ